MKTFIAIVLKKYFNSLSILFSIFPGW